MTYAPEGRALVDAPTVPIRVAWRQGAPSRRPFRRGRVALVAVVGAVLLGAGVVAVALTGATSSLGELGGLSWSHPCDAGEETLTGFATPLVRSPDRPSRPGVRQCTYVDGLNPVLARGYVTIVHLAPDVVRDPNSGWFIKAADPNLVGQSVGGVELRGGPNGVPISVYSNGGASTVCEKDGHVWLFTASAAGSAGGDDGNGDGVAALVSRVGCQPLLS